MSIPAEDACVPRGGREKGSLSLGVGRAEEAFQKWGAFELGSEGCIGEFRHRRGGTAQAWRVAKPGVSWKDAGWFHSVGRGGGIHCEGPQGL